MAAIEIDPTELQPGDVVLSLKDHDISGCHCDVRVVVERTDMTAADLTDALTEVLAKAVEQDSPEVAARLRKRAIKAHIAEHHPAETDDEARYYASIQDTP